MFGISSAMFVAPICTSHSLHASLTFSVSSRFVRDGSFVQIRTAPRREHDSQRLDGSALFMFECLFFDFDLDVNSS